MGVLCYVCVPCKKGMVTVGEDATFDLFVQEVVVVHKRKGIGSLLLRTAIERSIKAYGQLEHVDLLVKGDNKLALAFYERLGFQQMDEAKRTWAKPCDDELYLRADVATLRVRIASLETCSLSLNITHYATRQRLALDDLKKHVAVVKLVCDAHGTSRTLPHDTKANHRTQYLLASDGECASVE